MWPFTTLTSPAIPLLRDDIDANFIAPATGPWRGRPFGRLRLDATGRPRADSLFDRAPFSSAAILIVGRDFGAGARAGAAVESLLELGLRCVIGVSFAPAFLEAAQGRALLPAALDAQTAGPLADEALSGFALTVDLASRTIITCHGERFAFAPAAEAAPSADETQHLLYATPDW
ncbi:hypothetical protein [Amphiplicatus metriothermophilus]|uniref:3-isopropylmalate dehydratase n=1 Tax=Amphiplicatus metriothermophilus TaxID=1519374 RepID=A0A239PQ13_9PROT|nr:hypothetical protein [Amphiplicatus metriothermophilus]MBB5518614.1 3-isopropylmalate/(R)-2-methylmalate dehydratase small subunit [Amphiplicatus metriothermophilus]SNT72228.1 3-isopropylmalate/(R)-2-methylmalate dehydratase small subunit [Amphiplicatus metriothermophilus]